MTSSRRQSVSESAKRPPGLGFVASLAVLSLCSACDDRQGGPTGGTGLAADPSTHSTQAAVTSAPSTQSNNTNLAPGKSAGSGASSTAASTSSSQPGATGSDLERIRIQFKAKIGAQPFECGRSYASMGTKRTASVEVIDFRFYIYNPRLVDSQGVEVPIQVEDRDPWQGSGIALIDFENGVGACAKNGDSGVNAQLTGWVKKGNYRGLKFSNSVPAALNHADPTTLGAPLHAGAMTWGWLSGYKFFAAELQQDNAKEGEIPGSAIFHIGSQACDGGPDGIACKKSNRNQVTLPDFLPHQQEIVVDLAPIFSQADLSQVNPCHSASELCAPMFQALGVSWHSGLPTDGQSVFSVETKSRVAAH